jgi:hypothetical protein
MQTWTLRALRVLDRTPPIMTLILTVLLSPSGKREECYLSYANTASF